MKKRLFVTLSLTLMLLLAVGGVALAQTATPATPQAGGAGGAARVPGGWAPFQGGWKVFDAIADVLKLTPTQLFERLHSGKKLAEIAQAQGVDMQAVRNASKQARQDAAKQAIQKALDNSKITKAQADWMREGLENGWRWPPLAGKVQRLLRLRR